jgi:hypothetical protein
MSAPAGLWERLEGKVGPRHRDRLAAVYVRQSTAQQVHDHQESTRLQYGLAERAVALGWAPSRVLVCPASFWMGMTATLWLGMSVDGKGPAGGFGGALWCPGCRGGGQVAAVSRSRG